MSALRVLGVTYLASASAFCIAATFAAHPGLAPAMRLHLRTTAEALQRTAEAMHRNVWNPALDFAQREQATLFHRKEPARTVALAPPATAPHVHAIPQRRVQHEAPQFAARADDLILPDLSAPLPRTADAAAPALPLDDAPSPPASQRAAAARLAAALTPEMRAHFDMFLYVSKAGKGPLAQRMYVFEKQPGGALDLTHDWPASTGRERQEVSATGKPSFTDTPAGYYQLDPQRMYWRYHSHAWNQPMPWSMFFNRERQGLATGLAIHAASGDDIPRLGQRASAGCVHLSPQNAKYLYRLVRARYKGAVPRFAYDPRTRTMSNDGALMHDAHGGLVMAEGYKVLIFIEDYGGANVVAALF